MIKVAWKLTIVLWLSLVSSEALAVDPFLDWQTLHTENFQIHFADSNKPLALRVANIAEAVHRRLSVELNWQPADKVHLVLSDETDFANGFATVININRSVLFIAPPSGVAGLEDFDDWLTLLITHEYTHVLHLDKAEGPQASLRNFFGRFLLTFPNVFQPAWMVEGLATYKETDYQRKIGRGQSSLFASMMRTEVANGVKPVEQVNLPISTWPAGTTRYLYGVYFFEFIEDTRSDAQVQALIEWYSRNLLPFAINTTFKNVLGKDVSEMWDEYTAWLEKRFGKQIEAIERQGVVAGERISNSAYRTGPVRVMNNALYYVENNGAMQATLVKLEDGVKNNLTEVVGAGFDISTNRKVLISQIEVCNEDTLYNDLYVYDEQTEQLRRLTECGRYPRAIWHPDGKSIFAVKHDAAKFTLQLLDSNGVLQQEIIKFSKGTIVGWFDVSPDASKLVFSLWKPSYGWNLYQYDLTDKRWQNITTDNDIQAYPEFTPDGKAILYSADYDGTFNLYRYDEATQQHSQLTRTLSGAYQSTSDDKTIYYIGYNAQGTDVYQLDSASIVAETAMHTGKKIKPYHYPQVDSEQSDYSPWQSLAPRWWFPSIVISEDVSEVGFTTSGNDALGLHNYFFAPVYDFTNNVTALSLSYSYSNLFSMSLNRDNTLFKTASGQLDRIRTQDNLQFVLAWPNTRVLSSSTLLLALAWENNSDNKLFNGAPAFNDFSDNLLGLAWLYNSSRIYPLSISRNDGREIRLVIEDGDVLNGDLNGQVYTASWKEFFSLGGEHVLALSVLQGWGDGTTSAFRLGGESTGVGYTILLEQTGAGLFGRRRYPLRGYAEGLPQLSGQRARTLTAEWRFPGQRIERGIMVPPLGIMQWSGAVFAETGAAYTASSPDKYYSSAGLELSADLNLFYLVPLRARLGIAQGFDQAIGDTRIYLSLGSSF